MNCQVPTDLWKNVWLSFRGASEHTFLWQMVYRIIATLHRRAPNIPVADPSSWCTRCNLLRYAGRYYALHLVLPGFSNLLEMGRKCPRGQFPEPSATLTTRPSPSCGHGKFLKNFGNCSRPLFADRFGKTGMSTTWRASMPVRDR